MCRNYLERFNLYFAFNRIEQCARKQLLKITLKCQKRFDEVVYYLKQVFQLLYDLSVTPVEALLYFL